MSYLTLKSRAMLHESTVTRKFASLSHKLEHAAGIKKKKREKKEREEPFHLNAIRIPYYRRRRSFRGLLRKVEAHCSRRGPDVSHATTRYIKPSYTPVLLSRDGTGSTEEREEVQRGWSPNLIRTNLGPGSSPSFSRPFTHPSLRRPRSPSIPSAPSSEELNILGLSARGHARDLGYKTRPRTTKTGDVGGLLIFYRSPVALPSLPLVLPVYSDL